MTIIFSDGFESGDTSAWGASFGVISVQNVIKHSGIYALRIPSTTATGWVGNVIPANPAFIRLYVFTDGVPNLNTGIKFLSITDVTVSNYLQAGIYNDAGTTTFQVSQDGVTWIPTGVAYTQNQWYCLELMHTNNVANGDALFIDNVLGWTANSGAWTADSSPIGAFDANVINVYIDDVVFADARIGCMDLMLGVVTGYATIG